eukprot:scaffold466_cov238-Pinguiococcus_pyrenoidosus.AAC.6
MAGMGATMATGRAVAVAVAVAVAEEAIVTGDTAEGATGEAATARIGIKCLRFASAPNLNLIEPP